MRKKEIEKIILETILECIEDTNNYAPDNYIDDFKRTVEDKLALGLRGSRKFADTKLT